MCFTPGISLATAIIEFIVATVMLYKFRKNYLVLYAAIFIYILGIYQFTEFMLCISGNPKLWAAIGFITYTFLPAMALYFTLRVTKKIKLKVIFLIPLLFSLIPLIQKDFISLAYCSTIFVRVGFSLFRNVYLSQLYMLYYYGFLVISCFTLVYYYLKSNKKNLKKIYLACFFAGIITFSLPVILVMILPEYGYMFPSIYCEFALLFTIFLYYASYISDKNKTHHVKKVKKHKALNS